ncbi:hypothetical protein HAX54_002966 [Datura stramonium]|uniref:Pentatricopeptide repeat-containing protein n=1 Tax=Datura stramonium TaxID=4076 RepID=A0ABS8T5Q2_DATST|nr:hypothetical protein [Datura stramonium]
MVDKASDAFKDMLQRGVTLNVVTLTLLLVDIPRALEIKKMQDDGIQADVFSFNALIQSFCRMNKIDEAQRLLVSMLTLDLNPDNHTYAAFIRALCKSGRFDEAKNLFFSMEANGCIPDVLTCKLYLDSIIQL